MSGYMDTITTMQYTAFQKQRKLDKAWGDINVSTAAVA
jgi:hypothetical protein